VIDGRRYSHIVDPRTGQAVTHSTLVTVIAPTGLLADALASAFSVLPPEQAIQMAEEWDGVEARIISRDSENPEKLLVQQTAGFPAAITPERTDR
jgi:thiamine biosynthesis lipoprotein